MLGRLGIVRLKIGRQGDDFAFAPEPFQLKVLAGFRRKDVDEVVAVIGQNPLGGLVAFEAVGEIAVLVLELKADFVGNGLHLAGIGAGADDEVIGEGSDAGEVENDDVSGLFVAGGADGGEPVGLGSLVRYWTGGRFGFTNNQIRFLQWLSYYKGKRDFENSRNRGTSPIYDRGADAGWRECDSS